MVSRHHLIAWASIARQRRVVAIADPSHENAARRASEFGIQRSFADAEAMLAAGELDAIDIAAPREMHAPLVRLAGATAIAGAVPEATGAESRGGDRTRRRSRRTDAADGARELALSRILPRRGGVAARGPHRQYQAGATDAADVRRVAGTRRTFARRWSGSHSCAGEKRMLVAEVLIHHLDTLRMLLGPLQVTAARSRDRSYLQWPARTVP